MKLQTRESANDDWRDQGMKGLTKHDLDHWFDVFVRGWPNKWWRIVDDLGAPVDGYRHNPTTRS